MSVIPGTRLEAEKLAASFRVLADRIRAMAERVEGALAEDDEEFAEIVVDAASVAETAIRKQLDAIDGELGAAMRWFEGEDV